MEEEKYRTSAKKLLSKLPDLERLISKFGSLSFGVRPDTHPGRH